MVKGKLEGTFQASGKTGDPEALTGKAKSLCGKGGSNNTDCSCCWARYCRSRNSELQLEQAQAKYHLTPGLITIDELVLRSPNIRLTASGTSRLMARCSSIRSSRSTKEFAISFSKQFATIFTRLMNRAILPSSFRSAALLIGLAQIWLSGCRPGHQQHA